ncbi:MAG: ABC transporter permease [Candidatus Bathyarchaeia archaeon]
MEHRRGSRLGREVRVALAVAMKDMKIYYTRPPSLMFGVLFPFSLFFSFSIGRNMPLTSQIPVLISQTLFFASSSIGPVVIPTERVNQTFDRFLTSPVSLLSILMGKTLAGIIYGGGISLIPVLAGVALFQTRIVHIPLLITCLAISSLTFSAMGIMFASIPGQTPGQVMMPLNFVRLPLLFISGVYTPIGDLPFIMRIASLLSPLTHTVELARYALGGEAFFTPLINLTILSIYAVLFLFMGIRFHTMMMRKE